MLSFSGVGCSICIWLGLMDQRACDELKYQESQLDTFMWLKLLFVPTLGIILLTLFLLEEYCYQAHQHAQHQLHLHQQLHSPAEQLRGGAPSKHDALLSPHARGTQRPAAPQQLIAPRKDSHSHSRDSNPNGGGALVTGDLSNLADTNGHYPHPLTLLSSVRTTLPSFVYPALEEAPLAAAATTDVALLNPESLLAGQSRSVRHTATHAGLVTAHQSLVTLLGPNASFASSAVDQPGAFRVNLVNEAGLSCIVVVTGETTLREVFTHYVARHNPACWLNAPASSSTPASASATSAQSSLSHSLYKFYFHGQPLTNEKATLASIGLHPADADATDDALTPECPVINVALDWTALYHALTLETKREEEVLNEHVASERATLASEQAKWKSLNEQVEKARAVYAQLQASLDESARTKTKHTGALEQTKLACQQEKTRVAEARQQKSLAEGTDAERIELKRLEKQKVALTKELDVLIGEQAELAGKQARLEKERTQLAKESQIVSEKTHTLEEEANKLAIYAPEDATNAAATVAATSPSTPFTMPLEPDAFVPLPLLHAHLAHLEGLFSELQQARKKCDYITHEIAVKRAEVATLARKVHLSAGLTGATTESELTNLHLPAAATLAAAAAAAASTNGLTSNNGPPTKLDALPHLRARAAQLERETQHLLRWKSVAKHLELEAKECFRWKSLLRAALQRERQMLHPNGTPQPEFAELDAMPMAQPHPNPIASELAAWRVRARAFEREAHELRAWKRSLGATDHLPMATSPAGDFYTSPAAAAAAGAGLGLGLAYDSDALAGANSDLADLAYDGGDFDEEAHDRIDPLPQYAHLASEEDATTTVAPHLLANASSVLTASTDSTGSNVSSISSTSFAAFPDASSTMNTSGSLLTDRDERVSDELFAAEQEEERLVRAMRRDSVSSNGSGSTHANGGSSTPRETDEDELFKLGEALVRRNQHLHQHRLMLRYQQQQLAMQQQPLGDGSISGDLAHSHYQSVDGGAAQSQPQFYTGKTGLTGVLQASAPVFTPRYQADSSVPLAGGGGGGHYTRVSPNFSPRLGALAAPSPPATGAMLWDTTSSLAPAGHSANSSVDASAYWSSSMATLLDEMDQTISGASGVSLSSARSVTRDRSFSQPSHPSSLPPLPIVAPSAPAPSPVASSPFMTVGDPFAAFRRTSNLRIIDDDDDHATVGDALAGSVDSSHPAATVVGPGALTSDFDSHFARPFHTGLGGTYHPFSARAASTAASTGSSLSSTGDSIGLQLPPFLAPLAATRTSTEPNANANAQAR